ncbi:nucleoside triphosphate pyrophosphohydrolase [Calidifontibacillus oryziterrae]|uniref:nucleoside triphosphate pyrophosphohydrolase n=1 Tax=Calidifontibacillus oryziterrae TaxID=1191699 RepID=UPI0002D73C3C|nr:nucleoside triphosphate pyrophosphohydrolase [Calidifontibacillus oryziterrae]
MIKYNKLVRDKIPDNIQKDGKEAIIKILSDEDYKTELRKKANEELTEYLQATTDEESIEELADLLEIIYSLARIHGASIAELEQVREQKAENRGGFENKIFLVGVKDEKN